MLSPLSKRAWLAGYLLVAASLISSHAQQIIYDNTSTPLGGAESARVSPERREHGDQLTLAGNARIITEIHFEYFASFVPSGTESLAVRLYTNERQWDRYRKQPTRRLMESYFPLRRGVRGYSALSITGLSIKVPDGVTDITLTVQPNGLETGEVFGLPLYYPMTTGSSFNEFWRRTAFGGWEAYSFLDSNFRLNGAIRVVAVPEIPTEIVSSSMAAGSEVSFAFSAPHRQSMALYGSTNLKQWSVLTNLLRPELLNQYSETAGARGRFYKLGPVVHFPPAGLTAKAIVDLSFVTLPGQPITLYGSTNMLTWTALRHYPNPAELNYFSEQAGDRPRRFYRLGPTGQP